MYQTRVPCEKWGRSPRQEGLSALVENNIGEPFGAWFRDSNFSK